MTVLRSDERFQVAVVRTRGPVNRVLPDDITNQEELV